MFNHILVPIDMADPTSADKAISLASDMARKVQAELHFLTVLPGFGSPMVGSYFSRQGFEDVRAEVSEQLKSFAEEHVPDGLTVHLNVVGGVPHKEIIKEARRVNADLIIIPSHTHKVVERFLLGSVAARVVERATVSVMILRADEQGPMCAG